MPACRPERPESRGRPGSDTIRHPPLVVTAYTTPPALEQVTYGHIRVALDFVNGLYGHVLHVSAPAFTRVRALVSKTAQMRRLKANVASMHNEASDMQMTPVCKTWGNKAGKKLLH